MSNYPQYIHNKNDVPTGEHFVILEFSSISIPGDQRSRDAPGHGYPAHTEETVTYIVYKTQEDWKAEISKRTRENSGYRNQWVPLICRKVEIKVDVNVIIKDINTKE